MLTKALAQPIEQVAEWPDAVWMDFYSASHQDSAADDAHADVPGGKSLLDEVKTCEKVLMIPNTSVTEMENPYLRPDHEVDLSVLPPSSYHFEALQGESLYTIVVVL